MHKIKLTDNETAVICGSDKIIDEFGCFPSMENGRLCSVEVKENSSDSSKKDIVLCFDTNHWYETSSLYLELPKPRLRYITLSFIKADGIIFNSRAIGASGEIKFGNTIDREAMHQDCLPYKTPILERPFCSFYVRGGSDLIIEFNECECKITAEAFGTL